MKEIVISYDNEDVNEDDTKVTKAVHKVIEASVGHSGLRRLQIDRNEYHRNIGWNGWASLRELCTPPSNLTVLRLNYIQFSDEGVTVLAKGLQENTTLKEISLK